MGFFKDSKPKKTEDEKYQEWFKKSIREPQSKYFAAMLANFTNNKDVKYIDRMIDDGYELITLEGKALDPTLLIFKRPTKTTNGDSHE